MEPLSAKTAKTKSLVSIKNPIGPASMKALIKIIRPELPIKRNEELESAFPQNHQLQELILNDSKLL